MDILYEIADSMSKDELRFFKLFAHRQGNNEDRKDLRLLDLVRKNMPQDEDRLFRKLYDTEEKNAYYRLKNRLIEDLNRCLFLQHYDKDDVLYLYHLMMISRIYASRSRHQLALHFLKKAEARARKLENNELLDIIYGEFIQLSHQLLTINPETYIELRKKNSDHLSRLRQMDDLLAMVSYRLKITQNFGDKENTLLEILESTTRQFMVHRSLRDSARFRFKLYSLVSQLLLQRKDFLSLETYLLQTYDEFNREQLFNRNNHDTRLQMLTYIVNSLFKNGKTQQSLSYAEILHAAMLEYHQLHYERYAIFYYNALVNNYSTFDVEKAISILLEMQENKHLSRMPFYEMFISLNLATSYFDLRQYNQAIRNLNKLYQISSYKKADVALKFKIAVAELLIRFELGDMDFWNYRYEQVHREYKNMFGESAHLKETEFLKLLQMASASPGALRNKEMAALVKDFTERWKNDDHEDEIIKYVNWINEKLQQR
jgi:hypothetical protein